MKIGELARKTGVSIRMLRFYEEQGLLHPIRTLSGYRDFDAAEVDVVETIKLLGAAGMTLPVIRQFLPCSLDDRSAFEPCDELRAILREHMAKVDSRMSGLAESRKRLQALLAAV